ncbi:hypothetical protein chiPu_0026400, partial [Chiloscyllium punctatum]|nr:hypothetical protein [Chiloscyllium punctatum]
MDVICAPGDGEPIRRYNQADPRFGTLPTLEDVRRTLALTQYDTPPYNTFSAGSFRAVLEGRRGAEGW